VIATARRHRHRARRDRHRGTRTLEPRTLGIVRIEPSAVMPVKAVPLWSQLSLRTVAALETAAMTTLLLSYIWGWNGRFGGTAYVVTMAYVGIGILSHVRRNESRRELGLRFDNWRPALSLVVKWMTLPLLAILAIGAALDSWHFPPVERATQNLAWLLLWGTTQQYGLLCFFYRRQCELFKRPIAASIVAAGLFGLFHLPNPFLTALTLVAGYIACALYRREPNLFVIGATHAVTSFIVSGALPLELTHGMRVGPGYYRFGG